MIDSLKNKFSSWKSFLKNPIVVSLLGLSCILNALVFASLRFFIGMPEQSIILHYNVYFGVDLVGGWKEVYIMPAMSLFFVVANFLLAYYFYYKKERILSHMLMLTALFAQLGTCVAAISIIMINY